MLFPHQFNNQSSIESFVVTIVKYRISQSENGFPSLRIIPIRQQSNLFQMSSRTRNNESTEKKVWRRNKVNVKHLQKIDSSFASFESIKSVFIA